MMTIFRSTKELVSEAWPKNVSTPVQDHPRRYEWLSSNPVKFADITVWEQVYSQPGNFGIYVAWSPYVEFYIVVHYLFGNIEEYKDLKEIINRSTELGVDLSVNRIWIAN